MKPRALLAACCLLLSACFSEQAVTDADKALFVRPADFAAFGIRFEGAEALEKFSKARAFDGSYELTHTFTAPENAPRSLYLYTNIGVARRQSDAALSEKAGQIGLMIAFRKDGVEEHEVAGVRQGKLTLLMKDGKPIGNVFSARDGAKSYLLIMSGLYVKDADYWHKLIEPKLRQLELYKPDAKGT